MVSIAINDFAKRQTKNSRFGYYEGSEEEFIKLIQENFDKGKQGYRDGVLLVPLPPKGFYSSLCKIDKNSIFETKFISRREGEEPAKITVVKNGKKLPAKFVIVVLYRHDVLLENNENTTNAEWEVVSLNPSIVEDEPMHPMAMARNMLNEIGGTKAIYTGQQFAEAIWFWNDYAMCEGVINNEL